MRRTSMSRSSAPAWTSVEAELTSAPSPVSSPTPSCVGAGGGEGQGGTSARRRGAPGDTARGAAERRAAETVNNFYGTIMLFWRNRK